ncbi:hypothetical protein Fuma_01535 [Fuerstiella marisgermanici]|uniref:Uncharacterized protein n=1 Tax=Fuerstiella marisgermanici TaxID=1891926 RepID=A0A1P8WD15_9PLAN|nr:hypothetical protein Fuma_01535 [Fuerstiella marisgermanici]
MCDRTPNLEIPGDLELRHDLASAEDLEIRQKRTINKSAQSTCSRRSAHEAVKFNVTVHRAAANDIDFKNPRDPRLRVQRFGTPGMACVLWGASPLYENGGLVD